MAATISGSGTSTLIDLTTSGNTTLGDATTDTLTVGVTGIVKDSSGNVGIGTASPNSRMSVAVSSTNTSVLGSYANIPLLLQNTSSTDNNWSVIAVQDASGDFSSYIGTQNTSQSSNTAIMAFATNGGSGATERMRINSSGYVLVGCTALPSSSVAGASLSPSVTSVNPHFFSAGSATGSVAQISFINGNGTVGQISTSGSGTTYATSSDYRLKENVVPMQNALGVVTQLKPVIYKWKADGSSGQGFIAHELQEVVPDCVTGVKDAVDAEGNPQYQGIDTSFLVATLTAAIQEQQAIITQLQADVAALKGTP